MVDAKAHAATEDEYTPFPSSESLFESSIDTICPFGDIVLVVKDEFLPTARFQVSSCILAMSSKVFTALFSKNFAEGQSMCSRKPGEILEIQTTDPPFAMRHLLRMLHHADPVASDGCTLKTNAILEIAIIIDKYDCIEALRLPTDALLARYRSGGFHKFDHLATAAYMLDQPDHFRRFTKELVLFEKVIKPKNFDKKCIELLPSSLMQSLFCQQSIARQEIARQVTEFVEKFRKACEEANRHGLVHKMFSSIKWTGLWPLEFDRSIADLSDEIKRIQIPNIIVEAATKDKIIKDRSDELECWGHADSWDAQSTPTPDWGDVWGTSSKPKPILLKDGDISWEDRLSDHPYAPVYGNLRVMAKNVKALAVGVCLDCARATETKCRNRHKYHWSDTKSQQERFKVYDDPDDGSFYSLRDVEDEDEYDVYMDSKQPDYWEDAW